MIRKFAIYKSDDFGFAKDNDVVAVVLVESTGDDDTDEYNAKRKALPTIGENSFGFYICVPFTDDEIQRMVDKYKRKLELWESALE